MEPVEIPVPEMLALYNSQGNIRSPVTDAFFGVGNLTRVVQSIDEEVGRQVGFPVAIIPDDVFYLTCAKHANNVPNGNISQGVQSVNTLVFMDQVRDHLVEIRRHKLFNKWFVHSDRDFVLPRARMTFGRSREMTSGPFVTEHDSRKWETFSRAMSSNNGNKNSSRTAPSSPPFDQPCQAWGSQT